VRPAAMLGVSAAAVLTWSGCQSAAPVPDRAADANAPVDLPAIRWGATPAQMGDQLAGADRVEPQVFRVHQVVDGIPAVVTYRFFWNRLGKITLELGATAAPTAAFEARFERLAHSYGDPFGPLEDRIQGSMIAGAVMNGLVTTATVGTLRPRMSAPDQPMYPPVGTATPNCAAWWATPDYLRSSMAVPPPAAQAPEAASGAWVDAWRTDELDVVLAGYNLGLPGATLVESYRSAHYSPPAPRL
jgi:hypothetical protein